MEKQVYRRKGTITTLQLTTLALLLAFRFALDYLPEINIAEITRMGFGFVGSALTGAIAGPIPAMILGAAHDILKFALNARGVYFPGYTLTAIVGGLIYGLGLHRKPKNLPRIFITVLAITLICNLGLNTLWTSMLQGKAIMAILPVRFYKNMVSLVLNTGVLYLLFNNSPVKRLIDQIAFPALKRK